MRSLPWAVSAVRYSSRVDENFPSTNAGMSYLDKACALVCEYAQERLDKTDPAVEVHAYGVWFVYVLGGWKALVSTTLPDGRYYEVTHNKDTGDTYLDVYAKIDNKCIPPREGLFPLPLRTSEILPLRTSELLP